MKRLAIITAVLASLALAASASAAPATASPRLSHSAAVRAVDVKLGKIGNPEWAAAIEGNSYGVMPDLEVYSSSAVCSTRMSKTRWSCVATFTYSGEYMPDNTAFSDTAIVSLSHGKAKVTLGSTWAPTGMEVGE